MFNDKKNSWKKTLNDTMLKFFWTMAVPTLLCERECRVIARKEERYVQAAEIKFLKGVKNVPDRIV